MKWKQGLALTVGAILTIGVMAGCGNDQGKKDHYKVGIIQLVEHPALDAANKGFIDGLASKGYKDNVEIDQQNAQADQSNLNSISQRFVSDRKDLVLAIATPAAQSMANASKDIPIVGTAITDYELAKLVKSNDKPGTNVTGTSDLSPVEKQIDLMMKFIPNLKKIGVVYTSSEVNSQVQVEKMKAYAATKGITVEEATVSNVNDIQQSTQNLVTQGVQAIYVPTDNIVVSAISNLIGITDAAKIPVFPAEENLLKSGAIATYSVDYYQLGFQAGEMAAKILAGEAKPADMKIEIQNDLRLKINEKAAVALGLTIPEELRNEANK